ncbi:anti-sigma factor family protein [Actinopolyspora sp. H202]|uniref:anti-sigma factor family protein n=1 Tax=Actinopolyspora sp. H202 TaxID=1500456 RepID=UPI003EE6AB22
MNEESFASDRRLPCGHRLGELIGYHLEGLPSEFEEHLWECPHCRAELAETSRRWQPVRRLARSHTAPSNDLVDRTLATLRGLRDRHGGQPMELSQEHGTLLIQPAATLSLTRRLSTEVLEDFSGMAVRSCLMTKETVRVDLVATHRTAAQELLPEIRRRLLDALHGHLDAGTPEVSVRLANVLPPWDGTTEEPEHPPIG